MSFFASRPPAAPRRFLPAGSARTSPPIPPLVPILLPIVVTAIILGGVFARLFPPPPPSTAPVARWSDVTAQSGLDFRHFQGGADAPTTLGGAVVVLDFDRDGAMDLFFPNGTYWPWQDASASGRHGCALFRNDGSGRFVDVSRVSGINLTIQGVSAAVGDYNGDGWPDIYVTAIGHNRLLRNRGDGTFVDVTEAAGVGGDGTTWSSGAAWLDHDRDGHLDLVVCHYARWPREIDLELAFKIAGVGRSYGAPAGFVSVGPSLYRNRGDGRFEEGAAAAGLRMPDPQTGLPRALPLAVATVDANHDGGLDLLFTFQSGDDLLFLNQLDGSFRAWTAAADRREGSAAGLAATGAFPLAPPITATDRPAALRSLLHAEPVDGVAGSIGRKLGHAFLDYDLSGRTWVVWNTSGIEPEINRFDGGRAFAGAPRLLLEAGGRWQVVPAADGAGAWAPPLVNRGLAVADFDGDGDSDLVVVEHDGPARLFRNDQRSDSPWLRIKLQGRADAGGARVEVHTPRRIQVQTWAPVMGLLAQSESTLTFGLAEDARLRRVIVTWPSGRRQIVRPEKLNQTLLITEE